MVAQIPRILHAVWFGTQPPSEVSERLTSWKRLNPTFELRIWNESNSPTHVPYLRNALAGGFWANASNFVRLWALYREGGIYLDTDVELVSSLDALLDDACFLGFETERLELDDLVNNAVMGARPEHPFVGRCLELLLGEFHGTEEAHLSSPVLVSRVARDFGLARYGDQVLAEEVRLYRREIFYPFSFDEPPTPEVPAESLTVHHWAASWCQPRPFWQRALRGLLELSFAPLLAVCQGRQLLAEACQRAARKRWLNDKVVLAGPFRGVGFGELSPDEDRMSKIAGTFKLPLQQFLVGLACRDYVEIYLQNSGDGYFLVFLGTLFPGSRVVGFEKDSEDARRARENLGFAGLAHRVEVHSGEFRTNERLETEGRTLMIGDPGWVLNQEVEPTRLAHDLVFEFHSFDYPRALTRLTALLSDHFEVRRLEGGRPGWHWLDGMGLAPASSLAYGLTERGQTSREWVVAQER